MAVVNLSELPGVTESMVIAEIGTFFIAGMDTTAHTLSFFIYSLARYPDVQRRCHEEIDKHLKEQVTSKEQTSNTLPAYVEAVLKESMRLYPVAGAGSVRQVQQPEGYQLTENIHLPQGWWVDVSILGLHTYEGNWGEDAMVFKPERFLQSGSVEDGDVDPLSAAESQASAGNATANAAVNPLASAAAFGGMGRTHNDIVFAPFSYGMRNCVGMNLALLELRVTISMLLSKFSFDLGDMSMAEEGKDDDNLLETSFIMRPQKGLPIIVRKRFDK
jgi:cytochrome P450